ncbi:MAG: bifunctional nicotinamide-nucleotide adenylyltransferase/Nudix hydroxylase [Planctomycetes bacterium]|nr:bifunctional nicotinamide-nucleotide adenylyltransferase/Nudix hydroxylase [Planctomycetota bacterium]
MATFSHCVFIGRFQPFHNAHFEVLKQALSEAERVVIVIGSSRAAPSIRNPFSFERRKEMILSTLTPAERARVDICGVRDYYFSDNLWLTDVQRAVSEVTREAGDIALIGAYKDETSYYVKLFPQWQFVPARTKRDLSSTSIRQRLFTAPQAGPGFDDKSPGAWHLDVPTAIAQNIRDKFINTEDFTRLRREFEYIEGYRKQWAGAPFPPTFVTVDAVVVQSGHVLTVTRRIEPGKGLLALPGGFTRQDERLEDAMLRELKEETRIKVHKNDLRRAIVSSRVFDYPQRSLRGRTITHAYYIDLGGGELPEVKGGDDAGHARWMPLMDVALNEDRFFEDHAHIIFAFMSERATRA